MRLRGYSIATNLLTNSISEFLLYVKHDMKTCHFVDAFLFSAKVSYLRVNLLLNLFFFYLCYIWLLSARSSNPDDVYYTLLEKTNARLSDRFRK